MTEQQPALAAGTVTINGRQLPRMGYGAMGLGRAVHSNKMSQADAVQLVRHALDLGVQAYDTAQFYGEGAANRVLGAAFGGRRDDVFLISKVGAKVADHGPVPVAAAQRPEELREQVELNLATLGVDRLDVVYMRRMDKGPGLVAIRPSQKVPLDDQLAELTALRDEGKIGGIGMSHVSLEQVRQALPAGIVSISNIYNVLDRGDEEMMLLAEQHRIAWSPYFPLGGAGLGDHTKVTKNAKVQGVADSLGASPSQVGLAWLLAHSPQSLVIAGTTSRDHLAENVAAATIQLPEAVRKVLDSLS